MTAKIITPSDNIVTKWKGLLMVQMSIIEARVSQLGIKISSFYKPELRELSTILTDNEQIVGLVPGRYFGGY
jgi:hypothetical protein